MRILNVIASTDPKHGGVIEWVRLFSTIAFQMGHTVHIASMDNPGDEWVEGFPVKVYAFGSKLKNFYSRGMTDWIRENASAYDVVIVHGLWRHPTLATYNALKDSDTPYFVYTHGMLDPWFKTTYPGKHAGKWLYWTLFEYRVLKHARGVIFTCDRERIKARDSFRRYTVNELVTTIGIETPSGDSEKQSGIFLEHYPETRGKRIILFLGRIHPKKGCDYLVDAFAYVAHKYHDAHLVMAGPGDPMWITRLKQAASDAGVFDRITWTGMIEGDIKWGAYYASDAFILPSHQENFGISVVEAMASGLPVLISDKVDIYREIEADNAGLVSTDNLESTVDILDRWLSLEVNKREEMRANTKKSYRKRFEVVNATEQLLKLLSDNIQST